MIKGLRLIPQVTNIPFVKYRIAAFILSAFLIIGSFVSLAVNGLNFGIDFSGGISMEVRSKDASVTIADVRTKLSELGLGDISLQEFDRKDQFLIRVQEQPGGEKAQQAAINKIQAALGDKIEYRRTEVVGPLVGGELMRQGMLAVFFAVLGIGVYVWFRFEWQFAVGALVALFHDTIIPIGVLSLMQLDFNLTTVAAILTVAGYSTNDTVVVFDRVREYLRKYKKKPLVELLNEAINSTLSRTILTGGTTFAALLVLWWLGGEVIRSFVVTIVWGIIIGTYSSVFVATPVLIYLGVERDGKKKEIK